MRWLPNIKLINYSPHLPHNSLINKKKGSAIVCSCDPGLPSNRSCPDVMHKVEIHLQGAGEEGVMEVEEMEELGEGGRGLVSSSLSMTLDR